MALAILTKLSELDYSPSLPDPEHAGVGTVDEIIAQRLEIEGISLTDPPKPVASYVGYVQHGDLVIISGQLPLQGGELASAGLLGRDLTVEKGMQAARICAVNLLNQLNVACEGDLGRVERCIRLGVFVASTPEFIDQPKVANGASELIGSIFADKGAHARAAVGVASLPLNASVEVEGIFAIS